MLSQEIFYEKCNLVHLVEVYLHFLCVVPFCGCNLHYGGQLLQFCKCSIFRFADRVQGFFSDLHFSGHFKCGSKPKKKL